MRAQVLFFIFFVAFRVRPLLHETRRGGDTETRRFFPPMSPCPRVPASPRLSSLRFLGVLLLLALAPAAAAQAPLFLINEETTVRDVAFKFVESQTFEAEDLADHIATADPGFFDRVKNFLPLLSGREYPFDPIELQKDVVRLRRFYHRNGFLHPEIDYAPSQLDTTRNEIRVIFTVIEGPPLIIQDVGFFSPDSSYAYTQLDGELRRDWIRFRDNNAFKIGERFTEFRYIELQAQIVSWLKDRGYAFAQVRTDSLIDASANTIDLFFFVDPGPMGYFADIRVNGVETVSPEIVRRELPFSPGDRYSNNALAKGQREIFELNLFRVALAEVPAQPRDSTVDVQFTVREARLRSVSAETGYGFDVGLRGEARWTHRNFLGEARNLTISAVANTGLGASAQPGEQTPRRFRGAVSLYQPYFFSTDLALTVAPFIDFQRDPQIDEVPDNTLQINTREFGVNTTLLYDILPFRVISLQHTFSRAAVFAGELPVAGLMDGTSMRDLFDKNTFALNGTFGWTNDFINPRRGYLIRPTLEYAGLLSDIKYQKIALEGVAYIPITTIPRTSLGVRLFAGRLFTDQQTFFPILDPFENRFDQIRFYAGGSNDVRGFGYQLLGSKIARADSISLIETALDKPLDALTYDDFQVSGARFERLGGLNKIAGSVEARLPFSWLGPAWRSAVFLDFGRVFGDQTEGPVALDAPFQFTLGSGLRYETLIGFIRMDLAYRLNPVRLDKHNARDVYLHEGPYFSELGTLTENCPVPGLVGACVKDPLPSGGFWDFVKDHVRLHISIGQAF